MLTELLFKRYLFCQTILLGAFLFFCLTGPLLASTTEAPASEELIPHQYGKVVYQTETGAPSRIFIIANSHRSSFSGENGNTTLQSQIETFRIGELLIRKGHADLLLPEGFFGMKQKVKMAAGNLSQFDETVLEQRLADTSTFVNAELLLHQVHGVNMHQVEDRALYQKIKKLLNAQLRSSSLLSSDYSDKIEYLQKLRTATILERSVSAVSKSRQERGSVDNHNAVLTIGLSHLDEMLSYLETGTVQIAAPPKGGQGFPKIRSPLELSNAPIDVTVIVPRSLLAGPLLAQNE